MDRHVSVKALFASSMLCAVMGAGCLGFSKSRPPLKAVVDQPYIPVASAPRAESDVPMTPREELKTILQAFHELKSFRSRISLPSSQGTIVGTLDYQKPDRLHAIMQAGTGEPTELIVVDTSLYMRNANVSWVNFSKSATAKKLGESIRTAMSGDASLEKLVLNDSSEITKSTDTQNGCEAYVTTMKTTSGLSVPITICATNGLPKILTMDSEKGQLRLEYYDYNAVFLIVRPRY